MINYRINTASEANIFSHLKSCDKDFFLDLTDRVDVNEYSKKLKTNAVLFEAWTDDLLIGLLATYYNRVEDKIGYITNVSVSKKYEKNGIASKLMTQCVEYGLVRGFEILRLEVAANNINGIGFYTKFNFLHSGHKNNNLIMERKINVYEKL